MKYKYIWEDPTVYKVNKEDGHTIAMPFDNLDDAVKGESRYKLSLNGDWKFYFQQGVKNEIDGFENSGFEVKNSSRLRR